MKALGAARVCSVKTTVFSRWTRKGETLHPDVVRLIALLRDIVQKFYATRIVVPEKLEGNGVARMLLMLENRLDVAFEEAVKSCAAQVLEGPFPCILTRSGIVFGTEQAPPDVGRTIDADLLLDGEKPIFFSAELEVRRVEPGQDGKHYIAARFKSLSRGAEAQILRYIRRHTSGNGLNRLYDL